MDNFGGKGGQELVVSDDSQYVIKGLSAADHQQLELLCSRLATYVGTGPSLLAPFVLHFTRFFGGKESQFVVMKNVLPCDNYNAVFDLKGADDDDRIVSCEHHGTIERPSTWDSASSDVSTQFCAHQALARQARFSVTPTQHSYPEASNPLFQQWVMGGAVRIQTLKRGLAALRQLPTCVGCIVSSPYILVVYSVCRVNRLAVRLQHS